MKGARDESAFDCPITPIHPSPSADIAIDSASIPSRTPNPNSDAATISPPVRPDALDHRSQLLSHTDHGTDGCRQHDYMHLSCIRENSIHEEVMPLGPDRYPSSSLATRDNTCETIFNGELLASTPCEADNRSTVRIALLL